VRAQVVSGGVVSFVVAEVALLLNGADVLDELRAIRDDIARLQGAEPSPWLTVEEAADRLRTTPTAVYSMLRDGKLTKYQPNGPKTKPVLLERDEVDAWVTSGRT